jgi:hypothetical protein
MRYAEREIDAAISRQLWAHEAQLRRDLVLAGEEDQEALDRPPDPESKWRRVTVEECVESYERQLLAWRVETLATLRQTFEGLYRAP